MFEAAGEESSFEVALHADSSVAVGLSGLSEVPDGPSAFVLAALQRLERRLERDRRQNQQHFRRIGARLEDAAVRHPSLLGRWAELRGHVDSLAETVQRLIQRTEETHGGGVPALAAKVELLAEEVVGVGARARAWAASEAAALGERLGALESRAGSSSPSVAAAASTARVQAETEFLGDASIV